MIATTDTSEKIIRLQNGPATAKQLTSLKQQARTAFLQQEFEEARALCRSILEQKPNDPDAMHILEECPFDLAQFADDFADAAVGGPLPPAEDPAAILKDLLQRYGFRELQRRGFHVQVNDFYSPLNDCDFLEYNPDLWRANPDPAGIDWRVDAQLQVAAEVSRYVEELRNVSQVPPEDQSFFAWNNNFWNNADALVQYGLVRSRRPRRYVEIGCGWSSMLLQRALAQNEKEGAKTGVTLIEPYPTEAIFKTLPADWTVHSSIVQRAPLDLFEQLSAGDMLFYDGSHCAKIASDVNWFFFRILPRLQPGVLIHLHDIALPAEPPDAYIFERGQTWNEQYLLQAFLMHNDAYRILIANRYLYEKKRPELDQLYRGVQPSHGCSFWMEKVRM